MQLRKYCKFYESISKTNEFLASPKIVLILFILETNVPVSFLAPYPIPNLKQLIAFCLCWYVPYVGDHRGKKMESDPLKLELQDVEELTNVCAGNKCS